MPVRTYIDDETGMAVQEIRGSLAASEILKAQRELYIDMSFNPSLPCLWDATDADVAGAVSAMEMRESVSDSESIWELMRGGKTAILVGKESDYGMGRMYELLADKMPRELKVFRSREEAVAWLTSD